MMANYISRVRISKDSSPDHSARIYERLYYICFRKKIARPINACPPMRWLFYRQIRMTIIDVKLIELIIDTITTGNTERKIYTVVSELFVRLAEYKKIQINEKNDQDDRSRSPGKKQCHICDESKRMRTKRKHSAQRWSSSRNNSPIARKDVSIAPTIKDTTK